MKNDGRSIKNGGYNGGFSHETLSFKHEKYGEMVGYPGPSLKWWEMGMSPFNGLTMKNDGQPLPIFGKIQRNSPSKMATLVN